MRYTELFKKHGFVKRKDGKIVNPNTGKGQRPDLAKDSAARLEGFKNYKELQSINKTKRYKKFSEWYEKAHGKKPDEKFNKLYRKTKPGKRGKAQVELLRATTFQPKFSQEKWLQGYL